MPEPDPPADEDALLRRVRELEARVQRLEQHLDTSSDRAAFAGMPAAPQPARIALSESSKAVPALGRALLGMAGAYVLRALTESQALPQKAGVFTAIVYAAAWLLWAARTPAGRRAESAVYSLTAALVLAPLLWESTLRFRVFSTGTAAATLLLFTLFGFVISWHKRLLIVATIAALTGVLTAVALLIGSHDVIPFLWLLLAIAAAVEASACFDHGLSERWLAAVAADLAVALALYLATNSRGLPETYAPIPRFGLLAAALALPAIYFASVLVRTLLRHSIFTPFEAIQLAITFLLVVVAGSRVSGAAIIGAAACLACGSACYAVGFARWGRNSHAYLSLGFLLAIAGSVLALPLAGAAMAWSGLAVLGAAAARPAFHWHGGAYLLLSFAASGVLAQATGILLDGSEAPAVPLPLVAQTAIAAACYCLARRAAIAQPLLQTLLAALLFWPAAAIAAAALAVSYHALFGVVAPHAFCGAFRTGVLAAGALLLAAVGSLRKRPEFNPLVYPTFILGAYRLLLIDLRQDNKAALVLSLIAFGGALILLPRFIALRQTAAR